MGSVTSCVTLSRLELSTLAVDADYALAFSQPVPLKALDRSSSTYLLDVFYRFNIVATLPAISPSGMLVSTKMYQYRLLDRDETELLVYHWQPGPDYAGPDHPHIHVSASLSVRTRSRSPKQTIDLDKLHLPTGHLSLAPIVRALIQEFRIAPRRDDWRKRLDDAEAELRSAFIA